MTEARPRSFSLRTITLATEMRLDGWRLIGERLLRRDDGRLLWIPSPPTLRRRTPEGPFRLESVHGTIAQHGDAVVLRAAADDASVDLIELSGEAGEAFLADRSESVMLQPLGVPFGGPLDLAKFLVGDQVLVNVDGRAWPSEQVALSLYRIARLRAGVLWEGVASHLADVVASRVEQASASGPVQGFWERGETHVRLLADALLLLVAHSEAADDPRLRGAAARVADQLGGYGVSYAGGTWYLHDSLERDVDRNDLVLNTHVHAMLALRAAGRPIEDAGRALDTALSLRSRRPAAHLWAAAIAAADAATAWAPGRARGVGVRLGRRSQSAAARYRTRHRHLRAPGGYLARDIGGEPADPHYLAINLHDLAMLSANGFEGACSRPLAAGFRYARASGYARGQWRGDDPTISALYPIALRIAGRRAAARAAARHSLAQGWRPAVGWPGYEDDLWSRLAPGTP